jgi:hypothetical protein
MRLDLDASQLNLHMVLQIMEVTTDAQMKQKCGGHCHQGVWECHTQWHLL